MLAPRGFLLLSPPWPAILVAALLALAATSALAAADRTLLQTGVTCSKDIPACSERRCTLRTINDKDTYVCLRCMQGFVAAKQGANILQCGEWGRIPFVAVGGCCSALEGHMRAAPCTHSPSVRGH